MSTAIIFIGEIRTLTQTINNIKKNLIEPNNADIFIVVDKCLPGQPPPIISELEPKKIIYMFNYNEDYIKEREIKLKTKPAYSTEIISRAGQYYPWINYIRNSGTLIEYYQFNKGLEEVVKYENERGNKYEYIIKTRMDVVITHPLKLADLYTILNDLVLKDNVDGDIPRISGDQSCIVSNCSLIRKKVVDKSNDCSIDLNQINPIFKWLYDNDRIQDKEGVIFSIRCNVVYGGKRDDMIKLLNIWECMGDLIWLGNNYCFNAESQFHLYLENHGLKHLDFFREEEYKYWVSKELNHNVLKEDSSKVACEFCILRPKDYNWF